MCIGDTHAVSNHVDAIQGEVPARLEEMKRRVYGTWPEENGGVLVPICMTSLGQMGGRVIGWLEEMKKIARDAHENFSMQWWGSRLGVILGKYAWKMYSVWSKKASAKHHSTIKALASTHFD